MDEEDLRLHDKPNLPQKAPPSPQLRHQFPKRSANQNRAGTGQTSTVTPRERAMGMMGTGRDGRDGRNVAAQVQVDKSRWRRSNKNTPVQVCRITDAVPQAPDHSLSAATGGK